LVGDERTGLLGGPRLGGKEFLHSRPMGSRHAERPSQDGIDDSRDSAELNPAGKEGFDRDLIGGIEHAGRGPVPAQSPERQSEAGEVVGSDGVEIETRDLLEAERAYDRPKSLRSGESILNGQAHVRMRELRENRAVGELDKRVHY
jgi:hypothetical protein